MPTRRPFYFGFVVLVMRLLAEPFVSSAEPQPMKETHSTSRWVVSGLRGETMMMNRTWPAAPVRFHDTLNSDDQLTTSEGGTVEVLWGKQTLVTAREKTYLRFSHQAQGYPEVHLMRGEVAIAMSQGDVVLKVTTPTAIIHTHGGLIHITVTDGQHVSLGQLRDPIRAHPVASVDPMMKTIESVVVLEGRIEVQFSGVERPAMTIEAGHGLDIVTGQIQGVVTKARVAATPFHLPATDTHADTPLRAIEQVVTRGRSEAETLQQALSQVPAASHLHVALGDVILPTSFGFPTTVSVQTQQPTLGSSGPLPAVPQPGPVPPSTPVSPNLPGIIIATSVGVSLPNVSPQQSGPGSSSPAAPAPAVASPPPSIRIEFDDDDLEDLLRGRGRGRGRNDDDDEDERLIKGLRSAPVSLPTQLLGGIAQGSSANPGRMDVLKGGLIKR